MLLDFSCEVSAFVASGKNREVVLGPFLGRSSHRRSLYRDRPHTYRVNFAQALSKTKG